MSNPNQTAGVNTRDQQPRPSRHWAIAGGGMLGMTLALRLAEHGQRVSLFEAAPEFGGLASAWRVGDVTWDRHYHVTLLSDRWLNRLLDQLGLSAGRRWVETRTGFYTDGRMHSMSNTWEFLRFEPLSLLDKLRLGATIAYAARVQDWRRLEQIPVETWLRRLSGNRTFERIWLPLLRAKLGENYRRTSAAFIWATIARMYAARRTGLKKEMFGYVEGGYARILQTMAQRLSDLGVALHASSPIEQIARGADGKFVVRTSGSSQETADRAIVTLPGAVAARVCPQLSGAERARLEGIEYQGILCASVVLARPLGGYYVTNITEPWVPFTAVIEMTALVSPGELGGRHLVYLPKYLTADDPAWALSDAEIESRFVDALRRMYPELRQQEVLAFRVSRVRHVMPLPTLNYSPSVPPHPTSVPGLSLVGSYQIVNGTLNVNETVKLAEEALPVLLADDESVPHAISRQEPHAAAAC